MQRQRSCQYTCSIHVYVVPMAVCTHVLYTLIVTVQLSLLSDRSEHRIHPGDTTHTHTHDTRHTTNVELGFPTKKKFAHMIFLRVSSFNNQRYSSFLGHTKGERYSYFTKAKIFMHEYFDMNIQPCISTFLFNIK